MSNSSLICVRSRFAAIAAAIIASSLSSYGQLTIVEETLETDGNSGLRYWANEFDNVAASGTEFYLRTNNAGGHKESAGLDYDNDGFFWAMGETREEDGLGNPLPFALNPLDPYGIFRLNTLDVSSFDSLTVSIDLALSTRLDTIEATDVFSLQTAWDSDINTVSSISDLTGGSFTEFAAFIGDGIDPFADFSAQTGFIGTGDAAGMSLTHSIEENALGVPGDPSTPFDRIPFETFTFDIDVTGNLFALQLQTSFANPNDVMAWDNLKIVGTQSVTTPPPLTPVPEPSTYGLMGALLIGAVVIRRRLQAKAKA